MKIVVESFQTDERLKISFDKRRNWFTQQRSEILWPYFIYNYDTKYKSINYNKFYQDYHKNFKTPIVTKNTEVKPA